MWGLRRGEGSLTATSVVMAKSPIPKQFSGGSISRRRQLDTKIGKRDNHLRSAEFFDVEKYPDISVVVTGAEAVSGDTVDLRANLTVKGTTAPVPLQAKVAVLDDGAVRVTTQADINRKDFGVDGNMLGMIRDATTLTADVVFRRTGA